MNKMVSLIKASAFDNLTLFKIGTDKNKKKLEKILPFLFALLCFAINWVIAEFAMKELVVYNAGVIMLTIFILYTSAMTLIEGIYKSSGLLFNCKDDNLLLSLPISKTTVLFIRILKFYIFEMLYNALFLLPAMIVYAKYVHVGPSYFLSSFVALLMFPIIPIVISSIIGGTISAISAKFRFKTLVEILITGGSLIAIFILAMNFDQDTVAVIDKAKNIHSLIIHWFYPAFLYNNLVTNFNVLDLILLIISNIGILALAIIVLSKWYFRINSKIKIIKPTSKNKKYKIIARNQMGALINKELRRFISSPIYVTNSTFGLALFIIGSIVLNNKFDSIIDTAISYNNTISYNQILEYLPVIYIGFICFTAFTTFITSSMISMEGKAFNILKSFPVKPNTVFIAKILAALEIIIPCILVGDLIVISNMKFTVFEILMILTISIITPLVSQTIGLIVNLKYPRFDAENDTQVVKQSVSATISVFIGMGIIAITFVAIYLGMVNNIPGAIMELSILLIFTVLEFILFAYGKTFHKHKSYQHH